MHSKFVEKSKCRLCASQELTGLLSLGEQHLTGVFPMAEQPCPGGGPLELMLCRTCGLVQLRHSFSPGELYGSHYGYRSSLNRSMVEHLRAKVGALLALRPLVEGDAALDIGSNDGTLLSFYPRGVLLAGMDPSAGKFKEYYRDDIRLVVDFFSADRFAREFGPDVQPKIVTSVAMFYDLEEPQAFVDQIASLLHPLGVWHLEQSYLPSMLATNSYDTICHEHLEYYGLNQVRRMLDKAGLDVLDVSLNPVNGGSFAVTAAHKGVDLPRNQKAVDDLLARERLLGLDTEEPFRAFGARVRAHKDQLLGLLRDLRAQGKTVLGYGASTKGNVLLQYCGLTSELLPAIAEVNPLKFGAVTPGTRIPIVSEEEARAMRPEYFLVFPWHFRDNIVERERAFLASGGKLIFPLPEIRIVSG